MSSTLCLRQFGTSDYEPVWHKMRTFTDARNEHTLDEIWLVQHPPVFTQGQAGKAEHLLCPKEIPVILTDRGGQVTYHGPGQIVAYLLLDIKRKGLSVRELVSTIESSIIRCLAAYRIKGAQQAGAPGVYVSGDKIASIGLRVRKGCTYHGLSFNIDMDLEPFSRINPCGYQGLRVTQLSQLCPSEATPSLAAVEDRLVGCLVEALGYTHIITS